MESPPPPSKSRRRSSFLHSKLSESIQQNLDECNNTEDESEDYKPDLLHRMCFGRATYEDHELIKTEIQNLKDETIEWKKCYREAKSALKETKSKHLSNLCPTINWQEAQEYLTDEDKQFLKEKPQYRQFATKVDELSESAKLLGREMQISDHVVKQQLQTLQENTKKMKEKLCNLITQDSMAEVDADDSGNYSMCDLLQDSEMEVEHS